MNTTSLTGDILCEAIKNRQQIEFLYNAKVRIAEPQFYGIGKLGKEQVRVYQINESPKKERLFDVEKMQRVRLLASYFQNPGPNYNSNDSAFKETICKL